MPSLLFKMLDSRARVNYAKCFNYKACIYFKIFNIYNVMPLS